MAEVWKALWYREGARRSRARNCCLPLADIHLLSPAQGLSSQESVGPMGGGFATVTQTCDELGRGLDQVKPPRPPSSLVCWAKEGISFLFIVKGLAQ